MSIALLPLQILLVAIDFALTLITFGWVKAIAKALKPEKLRSVPVADDEAHRCHPEFKGNLAKYCRGDTKTLYEVVSNSLKNYADNDCMLQRKFLGWKSPKVKEFDTDPKRVTYKEMGETMHKFGAALRASGCVPGKDFTTLDKIKEPSRIAIFENTCPEWLMAAMGAFSQSISVATIYATLGLDAVIDAVNDNLIPVIVCNRSNVGNLVDKIKQMKTLKVIVYTNDLVSPKDDTPLPDAPRGVKIVSFQDFVASGDVDKFPPVPPKPETIAVVMYTSGSTGKPKGVVITHATIVGGMASANYLLQLSQGERYIAYLPLAHILELMVEFVVVSAGCVLCYADPKSLTTTGAHPVGALEQYSPHYMVAVPKIWDTVKKGLLSKIAASPSIAQAVAHAALSWRTIAIKYGFDTPLFNAIVFKKFKKAVGGKIHWALSGGGPLNGEVQDFIRTAFGFPLVQGYGLTETVAVVSVQTDDDLRHGVQGQVIPSVEVKMESTPEICDKAGKPYLSTDREDVDGNDVFGRGEICVRGNSIATGYYMMKDKTEEVYTEDGWFHTGDIGQFMSDGSIRIVDRKKNLVKLKGGEYIAIEKMETVYSNSDFVDVTAGGICCYGDGDMDRPVALMQLNEAHTTKWAKKNNVDGDFKSLKGDKKVYDAIMSSMKEQHAKSDLSRLEKLAAVSLLDSPWTPENGCLTAANKIQRRVITDKFEKEFDEVKKKGIFSD